MAGLFHDVRPPDGGPLARRQFTQKRSTDRALARFRFAETLRNGRRAGLVIRTEEDQWKAKLCKTTKFPEATPRWRERADATRGSTHVVVLAGGDGTRLRPLTRALAGDDRPKQFCALAGRDPMVVQAVRRAALVAPADQILIVLNRRHEEWYREIFDGTPASSLVVQPENRGTATAVLYALLRIAVKTPNAPVVILPSDHWVSNDSAFMLYAQAAVGVVEAHTNVVTLLGVEPTRAEDQYGWIEPGEAILGDWRGLSRVARFVEKPSPELAEALLRRGTTLWNTAVVVGQVEQLMLLFAMASPALVDSFLEIWTTLGSPAEAAVIERMYAELPVSDLSRHVLAVQPDALSVLAVKGTSWEDLGHPRGLVEARRWMTLPPAPRDRRPARRREHRGNM